MTPFDAILICEGNMECEDEATHIAAWQKLIDTGIVWVLQGWFGRQARDLIEAGYCKMPEDVLSA